MRARSFFTSRIQLSLLAALTTSVVWLAFMLGSGVVYRPDPDCAAASCSGGALIARNPYCLIDPTCASPMLKAGYDQQHRFVGRWQGLAWVANFGDPTWIVAPQNLTETFSIPNFMLFAALYTIAITVLNRLRRPAVRQFSIACCMTWYGLEVARWFGTYRVLSDQYGMSTYAEPLTYAVAVGALLPLVVTVWWRQLHAHIRDSARPA
jgi:hypothetical protein